MSISNYEVKNYILNSLEKKLFNLEEKNKDYNGSYLERKINYLLNDLIYTSQKFIINKNISFESWKQQIENEIFYRFNLILDDLPDENYHINYENGMSCDEMIHIIIKNNKDFFNY
jgi:hypothetical protein